MSKDVVEKRLEGISKESVEEAQRKLDALCFEHGIKPWKINAGKANWRELCYLILGLPKKEIESDNVGRPIINKKEYKRKVVDRVHVHKNFSSYDKHGNEIEKPLQGKELFKRVAKDVGAKPRLKPGGKWTKPEESVRGILERHNKEDS